MIWEFLGEEMSGCIFFYRLVVVEYTDVAKLGYDGQVNQHGVENKLSLW